MAHGRAIGGARHARCLRCSVKSGVRVMNRGVREGLASAACLAAVLFALVSVDDRVRDRFGALLADSSSGHLAPWKDRAAMLADAVVHAARDQTVEHAPLLLFAAVAAVLVILMVRT
jgi:hypothetical protein